ncbi:hypothetical protein JHK87_044762 [Glycine soja]|nr:hypothetical protein JHK87_044762 [Glycine soja]
MRRDKAEDRGTQRHHQQRCRRQPPHGQKNEPTQQIRGVIDTIVDEFSYGVQSREIVTIKANQKQARQCHMESLKVAPYSATREPLKPHLTTARGTQVISMDKGSLLRTLTLSQASLDDIFDVDPHSDTSDRG